MSRRFATRIRLENGHTPSAEVEESAALDHSNLHSYDWSNLQVKRELKQ